MVIVRDAVIEDAERIVEIYDYYVKNTAVTFEYDTPPLDEFKMRMEKTMQRYPYLVILKDGRVEGYAYAGTFVGRAAYGWSCETTVYLDHRVCKCGMGRKLYEALEQALLYMGVLNLYACIAYPASPDAYLTSNSADFHAHLGYRKAGEFYNCGYKFGRWYHMVWMEKIIGKHEKNQVPITGYPEINFKNLFWRKDMEYKTAVPDMADAVYNVLHTAIKTVYPKYYPQEVVEFFCRHHSKGHILEGIATGNMGVLAEDGKIVGTGCYDGNHITGVYVLPSYQKQGCGTQIMDALEARIMQNHNTAILDASLPAVLLYEHRGYQTVGHGMYVLEHGVKLVYEIMEKKLVDDERSCICKAEKIKMD